MHLFLLLTEKKARNSIIHSLINTVTVRDIPLMYYYSYTKESKNFKIFIYTILNIHTSKIDNA
ncbi:hypothetical protein PIROE2DRAFT_16214 [Piromyces sp. E2]|nr:hypothetical protein PIROE2DRAFT_16214 [Piromyces sp. E2]|eukprot:OUM58491.1 hypothetical protein PIROE2DRAFT_16214 [Piromyces sp. E2]